jgi:hypothetical protein
VTLPGNTTIVRVRGYWFAQDGSGVDQPITFTPTTTDLTDMAAFGYIKPNSVRVTPDAVTAYFYVDLLASNDPDLTPFAWTVTRQDLPSVTIQVDYASPVVDVGGGVMKRATWLVNCAATVAPAPVKTYYTSAQADAAIAAALAGFSGGGGSSGVSSVNTRTGAVTLTSSDVGLGNVNNTSDASKPLSTADVTALAGKAASVHTHVESDTTSLVSDLAGKAPSVHTHIESDVTSLTSDLSTLAASLAGKAATAHTHVESDTTSLVSDLAGKAAASHVHAGTDITTSTVAYARLPVGTVTSTVAAGDDARMTNARTPTAHTHVESDTTSLVSDLAAKAADSSVVHLAGTETITGVKTFSAAPVVPSNSFPESTVTNLTSDLSGKAATVHTHAEGDTTSLVSDLAGKALAVHTHVESDVSSLVSDLAGKAPAVPATVLAPRSGNYFFPVSSNTASTNTLPVGSLYVVPWFLGAAVTVTRLGAEVSTVGDVGSKVRLGIYADTGSYYPGALVLDAGQIAGDSATVQELIISQALTPGIYWLGAVGQAITTTAPTVRSLSNWTPPYPLALGTTIPGSNPVFVAYTMSSVTGALPGTFNVTITPTFRSARLLAKAA